MWILQNMAYGLVYRTSKIYLDMPLSKTKEHNSRRNSILLFRFHHYHHYKYRREINITNVSLTDPVNPNKVPVWIQCLMAYPQPHDLSIKCRHGKKNHQCKYLILTLPWQLGPLPARGTRHSSSLNSISASEQIVQEIYKETEQDPKLKFFNYFKRVANN